MAVSCDEIHEQITAFVDDRVDEEEYRERIASHIKSCPECRNAYERELLTKMIVRERFPRATTPEETRSAISRQIGAASQPSSTPRYTSADRNGSGGSGTGVMLPMLVAVVIGLGIVAAVLATDDDGDEIASEVAPGPEPVRGDPSDEPFQIGGGSGPYNLFNYAEANFGYYVDGRLEPQERVTSLPAASTWLESQGAIDPEFPGANLDLVGALASDHSGTTIPHLFYSGSDGTHLYVTSASTEQLREGRTVYITDDVLAQLSAGEKIWQETMSGGSLVMWMVGDRVHVAVADRSQVDTRTILGLSR